MGLFDKIKKKTEDTDLNEELLTGAEVQEGNEGGAEGKVSAKGGKFTLVIEDTFQLLENQGIVVVGTLHGKAAVEDAIYVLHPNGKITMSVIKGIEIDKGKTVKTA